MHKNLTTAFFPHVALTDHFSSKFHQDWSLEMTTLSFFVRNTPISEVGLKQCKLHIYCLPHPPFNYHSNWLEITAFCQCNQLQYQCFQTSEKLMKNIILNIQFPFVEDTGYILFSLGFLSFLLFYLFSFFILFCLTG